MDDIRILFFFERPPAGEPIARISWSIFDEADRDLASGQVDALGWSTSYAMLQVATNQARRALRAFLSD